MSEKTPSGLSQDLLDDFFAEADEHLLNIRQSLLASESSGNIPQSESKIVGELFHSFHSFKGISAIVGLEPAEALSHAAEDLLRLMRSGKIQLSEQGLSLLGAVTHKLEQIVVAFRSHKPLPGHESLLADIKSQCASSPVSNASSDANVSPGPSSPPAAPDNIEQARLRGLSLWKYTFLPSHELTARKININTIREELSRVGEILKSTPVVKGRGIIAFEFIIATAHPPKNKAEWEAKGVTIESAAQVEMPSPASSATSPTASESTHNPFLAPSHVVRVDLKHLDNLLRIAGEMVIHRSRLDIQLARLEENDGHLDLRGVQEVNGRLGRSLRELREAIMRVRLIPVAEIFSRLPFVVRDLTRQTSKKVQLKLSGQETDIDKYLIEKLKDPLLHMVRNAISHGIETAEERRVLSKPEEATIELTASTVGDSVIIKVIDDGKGIDSEAIIQRAKKLGLEIPAIIDNDAILKILCSPGFSTRDDADRASGRGVGMAVVDSTLREVGGKLTLESQFGKGTQFTLRLPLTVEIAEALLVSAAGQTCAVPQNSVSEIIHVIEDEIRMADGIEMISYRSGVLPIIRLAGLFQLKSNGNGVKCLLVMKSERGSVGLLVEKVLGQREVVVRTFRDPLIQVYGVSGATELGDGKPVLILDGAALTAGNVRPPETLNFA